MFKGNLNERLQVVESFTINTLSMFGEECFIEKDDDSLPRFNERKCFYGNS